MSVFEKLCEKIENEMSAFKSHYEALSPSEVYNDSYKINFFESFKNMLCNDSIDNDYNANVIAWLSEKNSPIDFLYEMYKKSDFEISYDWDDMLEWIKGVYFEEKRLERQELFNNINSLGLRDVPVKNAEYFDGYDYFCLISKQPFVINTNFPNNSNKDVDKEFAAFFNEKLLVKSSDYGCDTNPNGVTKRIKGLSKYTFRQEVWNFIDSVEQMFDCKCHFYEGYNGFEFAFEFGSDDNKGCYVFAASYDYGQEYAETLYLNNPEMIRDNEIANTIISIDKAFYTLLEEYSLKREDKVVSLDEVIKGAEVQKNEQKINKEVNVEPER